MREPVLVGGGQGGAMVRCLHRISGDQIISWGLQAGDCGLLVCQVSS